MRAGIVVLVMVIGICAKAQHPNQVNTLEIEGNNTGVFNKGLFNDSLASSSLIIIKNEVKAHKHMKHSEHVIVQSGEAVMRLGEKEFNIKEGDVIFIPKGTVHSVIVKGKKPLKVISIQAPYFDGNDRVMME
jgi:mannose-6-phosphate isomerase-like protein (cupin superfamily)